MSVLRRGYVPVEPDVTGFDEKLREKFRKQDPGGKAGKQLGGQLNRALKRLDLETIDVKADPSQAIAAMDTAEAKLQALTRNASTVEIKVRAEQGLAEIARFRKKLGEVGDGAGEEAATGFVARFSARMGPLLASIPAGGPMAAGMGALGLALAPTMAAGIAGGLTAGIGAGIIGAGLKLVAKDPQVQAAGKELGDRFSKGIELEAQAFKTPVLGALKEIDAFASRSVPKIGNMFRNVAPSIEPLTRNLTAAGDAIANSLEAASGRSAGPLRALGELVQGVGIEFGKMIDTLSQRSAEGELALNDLQTAITGVIRATTFIVDQAAAFRGWTQDVHDAGREAIAWVEDNSAIADALRDVGVELDLTNDGYKVGSEAAKLYRQGVIGAADSANNYAAYLDKARVATATLAGDTMAAQVPQKAFVGTLINAERAALGQRDAMVALSNQLRAHIDPAFAMINASNTLKQAQDKAAEAVKKHGRNSVEARAATRNLALAAVDMQAKAGALGDTFNGKLSTAMRTNLRAAGLTEAQIKDVAREFRNAKKDGDKFAKNYKASASLTGTAKVGSELWILSQVQQALKKGNSIPSGALGALNKNLRGGRMAAGGRVEGSSPTATADNIPAMLTADEWVIKQQSAKKMERTNPGALKYINQTGELPKFAAGGPVTWPYRVDASKTWTPSYEQVVNSVVPAVPGGATAPWMERMLESRFGVNMISGFRRGSRTLSGNLSYHARNRAVDFPPVLAMARFMYQNYKSRLKEAITPYQQYNVHNGRSRRWTGAVWNQHNFAGGNAHNHFAMANGGVIGEPVVGVGKSGASYSFGENGPETVTPGVGAGRLDPRDIDKLGQVIAREMATAVGASNYAAGRQVGLYARGG